MNRSRRSITISTDRTNPKQVHSHNGGCADRNGSLQGWLEGSSPVRHPQQTSRERYQIANTNAKQTKGPTSTSPSTAHPDNPQTSPASPSLSGSVSWICATTSSTHTACASTESVRTSSCSVSRTANPSQSTASPTPGRRTGAGTDLLASSA